MGNDEVCACRNKLIRRLGRCDATGNPKTGRTDPKQEVDLAADTKIEAAQDTSEFAVNYRHRWQVDDTLDAGATQRCKQVVVSPERIGTEHARIDVPLMPRWLPDRGEQVRVGVVPG